MADPAEPPDATGPADATAGPAGATVPGWKRIFVLVCASTIGTFIAHGLLYPTLPLYLTDQLGTTKATAGLVVSSMSLSAIVVRPFAGNFVDRFGRRPLLIAGPLLMVLSAVGLLTLRSVTAVLVFRLIQGAGSALAYSGASPVVADVAPVHRRASMLALYSLFFYIGIAVGPFLAELLISEVGYRSVWWAVGAFTATGFVLALFVPETGVRTGVRSTLSFRHRVFHPSTTRPGIVWLCIGTGWAAVASFLSLYARDIGLDSSDMLFLVLALTVMATRFFAGGLADTRGRLQVAIPSVALLVAGITVLAALRTPTFAVVGLILFGMGFSGAFPALFAMVVDEAPEAERGTAMSSFNLYYDLGAPVGGYGVGMLVDRGGFGLGFGAVAALAALGFLLLPILNRPAARPVPAPRESPLSG